MNKLPALAVLLFVVACKTSSVAVKTPAAPAPKVDLSAPILDSVNAHAFRFEWFSGKAKVSVTEAGEQTDFTANFRIKKDSAIWISISPALGIEVARMLMTKDSIRVIDRIGKKRYTRGYDFFKSYTSLPVDFSTFQNLVAGNLLFLQHGYDLSQNDSLLMLVSQENHDRDSIVLLKSFLPRHQFISDSTGTLFTTNKQYDIQYNPPFSLWRKIIVRHPDEMVIEVTFNKIKLNEPVKFPFKGDE